jgi:hypothetical protein
MIIKRDRATPAPFLAQHATPTRVPGRKINYCRCRRREKWSWRGILVSRNLMSPFYKYLGF